METKKSKSPFSNLITIILFSVTIFFVILTLISAIFPNLFLVSFGGIDEHLNIDSFELGIWAYPILLTNSIILVLAILYFKKKLPTILINFFKFIRDFEVSKQITFFIIIILLGFYIVFSVGELFDGQFQPDYYERVKDWIDNYSFTKIDTEGYNAPGIGGYLHIMLGVISIQIFDNVQVIPFLASVSLLVLTYFITFEITKKRFAGIIAFVILLQSGVFLHYDTGITYPNFWILLYLLSLYLIYKKWSISPISYILSILTKMLTVAFLPMSIFFIYRASISKQNKIRLLILYGIIFGIGLASLNFANSTMFEGSDKFDTHDFWGGFNAIHTSLRFDPLVILFILPLIVGLFFTSKYGFKEADSIIFLILGIMLSALLIPALGNTINAPYRFIPLITFFAIGVGVLLSKKVTE